MAAAGGRKGGLRDSDWQPNNPASKSVDRRTFTERSTSFLRAVTWEAVHHRPAPHVTSHTGESYRAPVWKCGL